MSKKIEVIGSSLVITDTDTLEILNDIPRSLVHVKVIKLIEDSIIEFYSLRPLVGGLDLPSNILLSEAVDLNGTPFTLIKFEEFIDYSLGLSDVSIRENTSPILVVPMSKVVIETTLSTATAVDDYIINVISATSFVVGQLLTIYSEVENRVFFSKILAINTLAITLDTPLDFAFPIGSFVSVGSINMNVNGSVTPQIFGVRNPTVEDIPLKFDIKTVSFLCKTAGANDLSKFGDIIGGLTRGIVLRRVDGTTRNIFNAKNNGELKQILDEFEIQVVSGNQQDGFTGKIKFGGEFSVIRIGAFEDLQMVIQDDLTTLNQFSVLVEGHEVVD